MNQTHINLLKIRKKTRVSQGEIAEFIGVSQNVISRIEKGERKVDVDLLYKYSEYFEMDINEILKYHLTNEIEVSESSIIREEKVEYSNSPNQIDILKREKNQLLKDREYHEVLLNSSQKLITSLEDQIKGLKEELKNVRKKYA